MKSVEELEKLAHEQRQVMRRLCEAATVVQHNPGTVWASEALETAIAAAAPYITEED